MIAERWPEIHLSSVDEAVAELMTCVGVGVGLMVDAMPAASGRAPAKLAEISERTGLKIVSATGLHTSKYYDDVAWTREESPEELAERFIGDIELGIDRHDFLGNQLERTSHCAGVIKVATLTEDLTPRDRRLFEAAALTSSRTGAPIITHTEGGLGGLNQIEALMALGVAPDRIALSHTDKIVESTYHHDLLDSGVYLCFDQALRWQGKNHTAQLIAAMLSEGYGTQILVGTDGARRTLWSTLGGSPGLAWLHDGFLELLRTEGLGQVDIDRLFEENPARYLSLV